LLFNMLLLQGLQLFQKLALFVTDRLKSHVMLCSCIGTIPSISDINMMVAIFCSVSWLCFSDQPKVLAMSTCQQTSCAAGHRALSKPCFSTNGTDV
jgi:hypothetical protein